jgi:hypothetical protein
MASVPRHLGSHTNALLLCALCSVVELLMMQQHLPWTPASSLHSRRLANKEYLSEQATNICAKKCFKLSFRRYSGLYIIRSPLPSEFWNRLGSEDRIYQSRVNQSPLCALHSHRTAFQTRTEKGPFQVVNVMYQRIRKNILQITKK